MKRVDVSFFLEVEDDKVDEAEEKIEEFLDKEFGRFFMLDVSVSEG